MNKARTVRFSILGIAVVAVYSCSHFQPTIRAQDNLTPGMLFGPVLAAEGQRLELCASNLGEGDIAAVIHFRNPHDG